jgi:hypothetical protein
MKPTTPHLFNLLSGPVLSHPTCRLLSEERDSLRGESLLMLIGLVKSRMIEVQDNLVWSKYGIELRYPPSGPSFT